MTTLLVMLAFLAAFVGLVGCIIPILPGPVFSFAALLVYSYAYDWRPFEQTFLLIFAGFLIAVVILDYVVPIIGAKKYGASKSGMIWSTIGMIVGVIFFPPWGMLFGAVGGAIFGELLSGGSGPQAIRASFGVLLGTILGLGLKLAYSGTVIFYLIRDLI